MIFTVEAEFPMNWNYSLDWAGRGNNDANDDAEDHRP